MLEISERVRPCKDRLMRSSLGRVTLSILALSSCSILMFGWGENSNFPLGPSTRTLPSAIWILTPPGMATGCFPIRDMANLLKRPLNRPGAADQEYTVIGDLPNDAQYLSAQALGTGLAITHDSLAGAYNRYPQALQYRPQL